MFGVGRPLRWGATVAALVCSTLIGCSSSNDPGAANRDCGFSVNWHGRVYWDLIYVLHGPQTRADVRIPARGQRLGSGFVPECPGGSTGSPATVYAVRGISPQAAVLARADIQRQLPLVLLIRKDRAIPEALLRRG
jgi:hypothetical protein